MILKKSAIIFALLLCIKVGAMDGDPRFNMSPQRFYRLTHIKESEIKEVVNLSGDEGETYNATLSTGGNLVAAYSPLMRKISCHRLVIGPLGFEALLPVDDRYFEILKSLAVKNSEQK